jgi:hypothetical protein
MARKENVARKETVARKEKRAPKKKRPPWGDLFGAQSGKPIERWFRRNDKRHGDAAEEDAQAELRRRMAVLSEHYGAKTFHDLAYAIARQLDPAFTIVDPKPLPTGKTAARARGAVGLQLLHEIEAIEAEFEAGGKEVKLIACLAQHQRENPRFRGMSLNDFEGFYYKAKRHWTAKRRNT